MASQGLNGGLAVLLAAGTIGAAQGGSVMASEIGRTYADIGHAVYEDSLITAESLERALQALVDNPSAETHRAAKDAWLAARVPYQQSEAYRFGNAVVDDWEGRVNSWPLDEGLIDYVDGALYGEESDENVFYTANIVGNARLLVNGEEIDASEITPQFIQLMQEADGVEANVATGYHAIEFLLWGQDLNGTEAGAGARSWTDYATGDACTNRNCDRRGEYLLASVALLTSDLEEIVAEFAPGGSLRAELEEAPEADVISIILTGMGSLSYGELAGERTKLGLMLHDPEEEHDCFSDNTHNSHFNDAKGIQNVYLGSYIRVDGGVVAGASIAGKVQGMNPELASEMEQRLGDTLAAAQVMVDKAESGEMAYDQMIGEDNDEGNAIVQAFVDALVAQTRTIERVVAALDVKALAFEGSDSLDSPGAVFE